MCAGVRGTRCLQNPACPRLGSWSPWVGCALHVGCVPWGGSVAQIGCHIPLVPHSVCPNRLHEPLGVGWELLDKSLTLKREGPTHPLVSHVPQHCPRPGHPRRAEGAKAFPGRAVQGADEKLEEREPQRLGGERRADSRVDFCLSGYYTVDLKRQMTAVAEEAIIESAMKH